MYNLNRQVPNVFPAQAIAPAGKRAYELAPYELGLISCDTQLTVDAATWCPDNTHEFVLGSPSSGTQNSMFPDQRGAQLPLRSLAISRIDKAHCFTKADAKGRPFVGYLGYDGISDCKTLSFPCGETFGLFIEIRGEAVRNTFGRNLREIVPFTTGCCDDCSLDEACDKTLDTLMEAIQKNVFYVNKYIKVNKIKSCCPEEAPFEKIRYKKFCITLCDNGTVSDLAKLNRQYPDFKIECIERKAPYSTYEICIPCPYSTVDQTAVDDAQVVVDTETANVAAATATGVQTDIDAAQVLLDAAIVAYDTAVATAETNADATCMPTDFIMTGMALAECDECPTGFTFVDGGFKVIVEMPYDGTTVTDDATALTEVQAEIPTATSAKLMGCTATIGTFEVIVPDTFDFDTPISDVKVTKVGEVAGTCTQDSPVSIPWAACGDAYKIKRTLCLTKKNDDCNDPAKELAAIIEYYEKQEDIVAGSLVVRSMNDCLTEYTVCQVNNDCLEDGCDTYGVDGAKFDNLPAYEGHLWKMCDCEGWTTDDSGCPVAPETTDDNCLCGLKFEMVENIREVLECTHAIDDHVEREPLSLQVGIIDQYEEDVCDTLSVDWTVVDYGKTPDGLGQFAQREEVIARNYDGYIYTNPKGELGNLMAHRLGYEYGIDPSKTYNHITLYHNYRNDTEQLHSAGYGSTREQIKFYVDSEDTAFLQELKSFFNATLLSHGVCKLL